MKFDLDTLKNDLLGKTIIVYSCEKFQNGCYGEVTRIDEMGRLYGTWGDKFVIPGEDIFELIGAPTLVRDKYIKSKHCLRQ